MATVVITISDEAPGQELSLRMEFSPPIKRSEDPEVFQTENPLTHVAAFLAWKAIDEFIGTEPTVTGLSAAEQIVI